MQLPSFHFGSNLIVSQLKHMIHGSLLDTLCIPECASWISNLIALSLSPTHLSISLTHTPLSFPPPSLMCICACCVCLAFLEKTVKDTDSQWFLPWRDSKEGDKLSSWYKTSCIINHIPEVHIDKTKAIPNALFFSYSTNKLKSKCIGFFYFKSMLSSYFHD